MASILARSGVCAALVTGGLIVAALIPTAPRAAHAQGRSPEYVPGRYIVVLNDGVRDPGTAAGRLAHAHGLNIDHVYGTAIKGFSAVIPDARLGAVSLDPEVRYVERDQVVRLGAGAGAQGKPGGGGSGTPPAQTVPSGIQRIGGPASSTAAGDGSGSVDVDVAVLDTGIDSNHPDLNVVGGVNFATGKSWVDGNGHGSHVAGTIAARDNNIGVVGVAPGARLYSVRVLDNSGNGWLSGIIAGVDWVAARAGTIEVANMSLGATGTAVNEAVNNAVGAGVVFAVAAGNSAADAGGYTPASAASALTISALDPLTNQFASFSNFGAVIDLTAPGVNILSTWKGGGYNTISGTSMATPHVAGAAALYQAVQGGTPADVATAMTAAAEPASTTSPTGLWPRDPDGIAEPLINVRSF